MKKLCLLIAIATASFLDLSAAPVQSYQELATAMHAGERFVFVLDLARCTGNANMAVGYVVPTIMMLIPATKTMPERVVTSIMHFSDHSGHPAYEFVKFAFNADGSVMLRTVYYNPQSFEPLGPEHIINCVLGEGVEIFTDGV